MSQKNIPCGVCLDIGGTNIRGTWVNTKGDHGELFTLKRPKLLPHIKESLIYLINKIYLSCPNRPEVIGIASAGPLDHKKKTYLKTANMTELDFFPIGKFLEDKFSLPVFLENDAQASALGEAMFGPFKEKQDSITLTLGTGLGTGVIINKKIWRASHVTGPELGHIYLGGNLRCGCGQIGCAETLLNKNALLKLSKEYGVNLKDPKELYEIAIKDIDPVKEILREYGTRLGLFISQLQVIFGIKNICISGGMSPLARLCDDFIKNTIKTNLVKRKWWQPEEIVYSREPNLSALYGMMAKYMEHAYLTRI